MNLNACLHDKHDGLVTVVTEVIKILSRRHFMDAGMSVYLQLSLNANFLHVLCKSGKHVLIFLPFQLSRIQSETDFDLDNPANIRAELSEKIKENNNLKNELERIKKDKNITSGLVTQMQRDMGNKVRQLWCEKCTQLLSLYACEELCTLYPNRNSKM